MKVFIGGFVHWWGPYQIADFLEHFCILERDRDAIAKYLKKSWVNTACEWIHSKKQRIEYVKVDGYDAWDAFGTMAKVCLPIMKDLQERKHSSGFIKDEDVPDHLRSTNCSPKEHEWDTDELWEDRWNWVIDEVVFALESCVNEDWEEQFHSGNIDINWNQIDDSDFSELVEGPKHTHKFDRDGYMEYSKRIDNGLRLFGTYWRNWWI